jgi:hypothetical protein
MSERNHDQMDNFQCKNWLYNHEIGSVFLRFFKILVGVKPTNT